ncbi:HepT-like ribonuclease domain-containing protein [Phocaeicola sp.]
MEFTLKEEIIDKLNQILESIDIIQGRCKEYHSVDDFLQTPWGMTVLDACIMRIQVIGETIKAVDDKTKQSLLSEYPQIPWKKVIGLRNIISHEYANIDYDIIWVVIVKYLPSLAETVRLIKSDLL